MILPFDIQKPFKSFEAVWQQEFFKPLKLVQQATVQFSDAASLEHTVQATKFGGGSPTTTDRQEFQQRSFNKGFTFSKRRNGYGRQENIKMQNPYFMQNRAQDFGPPQISCPNNFAQDDSRPQILAIFMMSTKFREWQQKSNRTTIQQKQPHFFWLKDGFVWSHTKPPFILTAAFLT